jgi:hypothetical protein
MPLVPRRPRSAFLLSLAAVAACTDAATAPTGPSAAGPAAAKQQPARPDGVAGAIPTRAQERPGTFADMPDRELWEHIAFSDGRAVVGLKAPGAARGVWRGEVLVDMATASQARQAVARHAGVTLVAADEVLPLLDVVIAGPEALQKLRRLPLVDYVEPARARGDIAQWGSVGGCGWPGAWDGEPLVTTARGDRHSVRFDAMAIPAAWDVLTAGRRTSGAGVTIGSIDTGISVDQAELRTGSRAARCPTARCGTTTSPRSAAPTTRAGTGRGWRASSRRPTTAAA